MSVLKIKNGNTWEEIPVGGVGVPSGGTAGQILMKSSATDYADEWADISEAGAMSKWTLLWTNASPTSSFAAQTVSLDLRGYDAVVIVVDADRRHTFPCFVGFQYDLSYLPSGYNAASFGRLATVSSVGVDFGAGYYNTGANNTVAVPQAIYGIKGVQTA